MLILRLSSKKHVKKSLSKSLQLLMDPWGQLEEPFKGVALDGAYEKSDEDSIACYYTSCLGLEVVYALIWQSSAVEAIEGWCLECRRIHDRVPFERIWTGSPCFCMLLRLARDSRCSSSQFIL